MENSYQQQNYDTHAEESECPECGNRYSESPSSSQSSSSQHHQRILIPLHKDLLQQNTNQQGVESMLITLQKQIQNLKTNNIEKDRIIEQMKREMEINMANFGLHGQINRQNQQISRLRNQIHLATINQNYSSSGNVKTQGDQPLMNKLGKNSLVDREYGFVLENRKMHKKANRDNDSCSSFGNDFNLKSTYKILKKGHSQSKNKQSLKSLQKLHQGISLKQKIYTERSNFLSSQQNNQKAIFKISYAKKRIEELEALVKSYEEQFVWLNNFAQIFVKTMEKIGEKKHSEKIFLERWSFKKKVKACWRYLKQLLTFLYKE